MRIYSCFNKKALYVQKVYSYIPDYADVGCWLRLALVLETVPNYRPRHGYVLDMATSVFLGSESKDVTSVARSQQQYRLGRLESTSMVLPVTFL